MGTLSIAVAKGHGAGIARVGVGLGDIEGSVDGRHGGGSGDG